jgi:nucleotide-binding universal stress UspA family protein
MQPVWKVLAPIDLTKSAEARVERAIQATAAMRGELTLLYVVDQRRLQKAEPVEWPANALATRAKCRVHRVVLPGRTAETINRHADDIGADLVAITSQHYAGWTRIWNKSVAAEVAHRTNRPVWFTRSSVIGTGHSFRLRKILCVVSLDQTDDAVIAHASVLARRSTAEMMLLRVVPEISEASLAYGVIGVEDRPLSERVAVQRIRELSKSLPTPHTFLVTSGGAYKSIGKAVREYGADVTVADRTRTGSARSAGLDLRSVLSELSCPLVSVAAGVPVYWLVEEESALLNTRVRTCVPLA